MPRSIPRLFKSITLPIALMLAFANTSAAHSPTSRFAGAAELTAPAGISADGRFQSDAALLPPSTAAFSDEKSAPVKASAPPAPVLYAQTDGRFGLNAELVNTIQGAGAPCNSGGPDIFKNGFE